MVIQVGYQDISSPTSYSKQGHLGGQTRLLWALASLNMKTSMHGDCTDSLVNLFQTLTVLIIKKVFPYILSECLISIFQGALTEVIMTMVIILDYLCW